MQSCCPKKAILFILFVGEIQKQKTKEHNKLELEKFIF